MTLQDELLFKICEKLNINIDNEKIILQSNFPLLHKKCTKCNFTVFGLRNIVFWQEYELLFQCECLKCRYYTEVWINKTDITFLSKNIKLGYNLNKKDLEIQ